ncbi:MAG: ABC transporter substrate-binding protein [Deltaproteobacteria bacterium]|nr:ABC transporter substrate-binding protein [Deltaproteobacteria bacterium]
MNEKGELAGFSIEVVREIQRRINNSDPIKIVPESRALKIASQKSNVVLFSFSRTPEREEKFHWITLLLRKPWVLYAKKGANIQIENLEDAKKFKSIGVVNGDIRALHLQRMGFTNLHGVSTHEQNVRKLRRNRIEAIFYEPQGMASACRKLGIPMSEFEVVYKTEPSEGYIMMSKVGTKPAAVKKWRDTAFQLKEDGTFHRIAEKWAAIICAYTGASCSVKDGVLHF